MKLCCCCHLLVLYLTANALNNAATMALVMPLRGTDIVADILPKMELNPEGLAMVLGLGLGVAALFLSIVHLGCYCLKDERPY